MAFVRTSTGLSNQHLFHDVDYVIFVEGGQSYSKLEIDQGNYNEESIDTIFWSKIINKYKSESQFKFKAVGSKTAVLKVAEDIIDNNLTTVYAAMDQEFDTVLGKLYKHDNILYTFGYSWENDVWNELVIQNIVTTASAKEIELNEVIVPFEKFVKDIKFSVYGDAYLFSKSSSFFPRPSNHLKLIDCTNTTPPSVKKEEVANRTAELGLVKNNVYSFGSRKNICCRTNIYGHLLCDVCKLLVKYLLKVKHNITGFKDEIIRRMAINIFIEMMPEQIDNHYRLLLSNDTR
jgi:hypothetical protein